MHGRKKYTRRAFLKRRPPDFFQADPLALSPAKREIFMANWESSYGADLLDKVAKSSYCNRLFAPDWKLDIFSQCENRFQIASFLEYFTP